MPEPNQADVPDGYICYASEADKFLFSLAQGHDGRQATSLGLTVSYTGQTTALGASNRLFCTRIGVCFIVAEAC